MARRKMTAEESKKLQAMTQVFFAWAAKHEFEPKEFYALADFMESAKLEVTEKNLDYAVRVYRHYQPVPEPVQPVVVEPLSEDEQRESDRQFRAEVDKMTGDQYKQKMLTDPAWRARVDAMR
jgi:hypothetical protein